MSFLSNWISSRRFNSFPEEHREIVFYAESAADWPHFRHMVSALTRRGRVVSYVTSDPLDPVLRTDNERIRALCIGSGTFRTLFFLSLDARVMVMTLPELDKYNLKRSVNPCHYVYVFHSLNSTHMVYRKGAFDAYDTIFCSGPHHVREISATEELYGLDKKRLFEHGYGRMDSIVEGGAPSGGHAPSPGRSKRLVLASSWGTGSVIEDDRCFGIIDALLSEGHEIAVRLHPMTSRRMPAISSKLERTFRDRPLEVVCDMDDRKSLETADIMISDWSGAALEFAFGLGRPVLFVDMPRKVNNPDWEEIGIEPFEVSIRSEIGEVASPDRPGDFAPAVLDLTSRAHLFGERLIELRDEHIFNVGRSGEAAADEIVAILSS